MLALPARLWLGDGSEEINVNRQSNENVSVRVESRMRERERSAFVGGATQPKVNGRMLRFDVAVQFRTRFKTWTIAFLLTGLVRTSSIPALRYSTISSSAQLADQAIIFGVSWPNFCFII